MITILSRAVALRKLAVDSILVCPRTIKKGDEMRIILFLSFLAFTGCSFVHFEFENLPEARADQILKMNCPELRSTSKVVEAAQEGQLSAGNFAQTEPEAYALIVDLGPDALEEADILLQDRLQRMRCAVLLRST